MICNFFSLANTERRLYNGENTKRRVPSMNVWKLHGAGNDFLMIDDRTCQFKDRSSLAKSLCHRQYGIGADGLIAVENSSVADIKMSYFNSDGSVAAMCGNGLRCFSKFVRDSGIVDRDRFTVETGDGTKGVAIMESGFAVSRIAVDMGDVPSIASIRLYSAELAIDGVEVIFMHFGVPHAVVFVDGSSENDGSKTTSITEEEFLLELMELASSLGPDMEKNPAFAEGSNINFVRLLSDDRLLLCTWERGAGRTLACGTGSCASAIAARARGVGTRGASVSSPAAPPLCPDAVQVRMPGGEVTVRFAAAGAETVAMVVLEGTAHLICKAEVPDLL
jgi:diaminopimelate epimerase